MARYVVIIPSPEDLGYHHQVTRDALTSRCVRVRCPGDTCWRLVDVDSRDRLADHDEIHHPHGHCELSGTRVIDRAHPIDPHPYPRFLVRSRRMGA